jgi:hypothetical protein
VGRLSLPSGGEKALTAVAMLVAIFRARPSPFYIMDEVEAALDDANLRRLLGLFERLRGRVEVFDGGTKSPSLAGEFGGDHFACVGRMAGGGTHRRCPAGFGHPGGELVGPGGVLRGWDPTQVCDRRFSGSRRKAPGGAHVQSLDLS